MPELIKYIIKTWLLVILLTPVGMLIHIDLIREKSIAAFMLDIIDVLPIMIFTALVYSIPTLLVLIILGLIPRKITPRETFLSKGFLSLLGIIGIIITSLLTSLSLELIFIYSCSTIITSLALLFFPKKT